MYHGIGGSPNFAAFAAKRLECSDEDQRRRLERMTQAESPALKFRFLALQNQMQVSRGFVLFCLCVFGFDGHGLVGFLRGGCSGGVFKGRG